MTSRNLLVAGLLALLLTSCGQSNVASHLASAPTPGGSFENRCKPDALDDKPLVVALASSDKLAMESRVRSGPLVVRYRDCKIELLARCAAKGSYSYTGGTLKKVAVSAKTADELFAKMPVGAARLATTVETHGMIAVAMAMVGRYEADTKVVERSALEGDCAGATHWVSGITVGAYHMSSGADAAVGAEAALYHVGVGAKSSSSRESLSEDGDGKACLVAADADTRPPAACGALLRFELDPVKEGHR